MIQVINRAVDVLEYLAEEPGTSRSLSDISQKLNLNTGTCANIIKTLVARQLVEKLDNKQGYLLGNKLFVLTATEGYKKDLIAAADPEMQKLTAQFNENCCLSILHNELRIVINSITGEHDVQALINVKKRAYDSASGRLLLGMLSKSELVSFTKNYGLPRNEEWEGVSDEKLFWEQIEEIKKQKYAIHLASNKIIGIAVPVFKSEKVVASLSVYMPEFRFDQFLKQKVLEELSKASETISSKLLGL